jgi:demethylmenaquinone methyltransferase/2-methoxy-6-polyprenyl-1,4-benzoquinol methylase
LKDYYDTRAPEYDEWYLGLGRFAALDRPGWHEEVERLTETLAALPPARTLDVACGTGFLTRHLRGQITGLDQSERMLEIAGARVPDGDFVQGDALPLPFGDHSFERIVTGHFYGHLDELERTQFLAEARRVAPELVVVDSAVRVDHDREEWQTRILNDGSQFEVYKRYFDGPGLAAELGCGEVLLDGRWFVCVRAPGIDAASESGG